MGEVVQKPAPVDKRVVPALKVSVAVIRKPGFEQCEVCTNRKRCEEEGCQYG